MSCLSRLCIQHDRTGAFWQWRGNCGGNPADTQKVKDFMRAYEVEWTEAGVQENSAVPVSEVVVRRQLGRLLAEGLELLGECHRIHASRVPALWCCEMRHSLPRCGRALVAEMTCAGCALAMCTNLAP